MIFQGGGGVRTPCPPPSGSALEAKVIHFIYIQPRKVKYKHEKGLLRGLGAFLGFKILNFNLFFVGGGGGQKNEFH